MSIGEAAGIAASLSVNSDVSVNSLDKATLKELVDERGFVL
jgi:hypothetical protein